jgi:hypothetical protein
MVEIGALYLEQCALKCGDPLDHTVLCKMINVVIFGHVPRLRSGNHPLKESGWRRATFIYIGIPNPESPISVKIRIGGKT